MSKKIFFASAAKAAFALAAVVMMSLAFAACGSDNDDDGGGGGTPLLPTPTANTVTLDGTEKPILMTEYEDNGKGNYYLNLYLSADRKERVEFELNKDIHMTGSPIKLTEKEKKHDGKWYWIVEYYKPDDTTLIYTFAKPGNEDPVFTTGTFTISGSPESTINIKLENGRVKGKDGKEYTLTISYSGKMMEK